MHTDEAPSRENRQTTPDGDVMSSATPRFLLKCVSCEKEYRPEEQSYTCPACGPLLGTLDVIYDFDALRPPLQRDSLQGSPEEGHWRYLPFLPITATEFIQPLAVGLTPLYKSERLASEWGLKTVWVKDDGRNPTASFKDRASSVAVVKALEAGARGITAASTGNAASSLAAFTALAKLPTYIFVPESAPRAKVTQLLLYGAKVIQVRGTYDEAFDLCCQAAEKWGWYNRSTAINPYLGEGKKTGAMEICQQLDWNVPDYVFVAVGDGCILQATWKGFKDFHAAGLIDKLPRLVGVQAEGSAPLFKAWQAGAAQCEPLVPHTVADSISVGVPRDQVKALRAARESGGAFVTVTDDEILAAISTLALQAGVLAEPAGATALAGLKKLAASGVCSGDDTAVVMVTGNGLKDIDGVMKAVQQQAMVVDNSLDAVASVLNL